VKVIAKTCCLIFLLLFGVVEAWADGPPTHEVSFHQEEGTLVINVNGHAWASYVFHDPTQQIPRPHFAHVKAPNGIQVTRNHPPLAGQDRTDHATMHPGIWLAFGDLDGEDFWRNKAKVEHVRFIDEPQNGIGGGSFTEEKQYLRPDGTVVCTERFRCQLHARKQGYFLIWDSTFRGDKPFYFGDQEEMGLGFRVATPLNELVGGQLNDAAERHGAAAIWSQSSNWCDYRGTIGDSTVGMTLMCHPDNFRPSWMHARNYGFVAANPFGREAMHKGPRSKVVVKAGESLRLRYAVFIHANSGGQLPDIPAAYADYLTLARPSENESQEHDKASR